MLEEKIGQMLIMGFKGTELDAEQPIAKAILARQIGGVILFAYNIESPSQLRRLTQQLQQYAKEAGCLPLWISIDYEGGTVSRLSEQDGFPPTYSAAEISQLTLPQAKAQAMGMAKTLKEAGININFAPVLDVNVNSNNPIIGKRGRSFSSDSKKVAEYAALFAHAFNAQGIVACFKHFPGHGSSSGDTHAGFVDVTQTWQPSELEPYQNLLPQDFAAMVMAAHVVHLGLDKNGYPASLSRAMITELLRQKLNYAGVVVTDDMQMRAIADHYRLSESINLAINAGVDLFIFGNQLSEQPQDPEELIKLICAEITAGRIKESQVNQSYERILNLKNIFATTRQL